MTTASTRRRDPEGRRRAIVEAAAALIADRGVVDITHRQVARAAGVPLGATTYYFASLADLVEAALLHHGEEIDAQLREMAAVFAQHGATPPVLAATLAEYLADRPRVRADSALYFAGTFDPALRPLALRWYDGFVAVLEAHLPRATAVALAVLTDGASAHALLHDQPLSAAELEAMAAGLIGAGADGAAGGADGAAAGADGAAGGADAPEKAR